MPLTIVKNASEHLYAAEPETPAGRELASALLRLRRAEREQESRRMSATGLSSLDLAALRYLVQAARDGRHVGPKDLTRMLDTSSANVTNIVDRLVRRGFIERVNHPTDRRARFLEPTALGVEQIDGVFARQHAALVAEIDALDAESATIAARVLERLTGALDALD